MSSYKAYGVCFAIFLSIFFSYFLGLKNMCGICLLLIFALNVKRTHSYPCCCCTPSKGLSLSQELFAELRALFRSHTRISDDDFDLLGLSTTTPNNNTQHNTDPPHPRRMGIPLHALPLPRETPISSSGTGRRRIEASEGPENETHDPITVSTSLSRMGCFLDRVSFLHARRGPDKSLRSHMELTIPSHCPHSGMRDALGEEGGKKTEQPLSPACVQAVFEGHVLRLRGSGGDDAQYQPMHLPSPLPFIIRQQPKDAPEQNNVEGSSDQQQDTVRNSLLLWNGEVFESASFSSDALSQCSDTRLVGEAIHALEWSDTRRRRAAMLGEEPPSDTQKDRDDVTLFMEDIVRFLETLRGPWSLIYFSERYRVIVFGRDPLGRRSLVLSHLFPEKKNSADMKRMMDRGSDPPSLGDDPTTELPTIDSASMEDLLPPRCNHDEKHFVASHCPSSLPLNIHHDHDDDDVSTSQQALPSLILLSSVGAFGPTAETLEVPVGGLYCISLPPRDHVVRHQHHETVEKNGQKGEQDDQRRFRCSFRAWRASSMHSVHPLLRWKLLNQTTRMSSSVVIPRNVQPSEDAAAPHHCAPVVTMPQCSAWHPNMMTDVAPSSPQPGDAPMAACYKYFHALSHSVRLRICNQTRHEAATAPIGILFSGGIDCTILAAIAHQELPLETPIELINVAFTKSPTPPPHRTHLASNVERIATPGIGDKPESRGKQAEHRLDREHEETERTTSSPVPDPDGGTRTHPHPHRRAIIEDLQRFEDSPDRVTARESFLNLLSVLPRARERDWRFVRVDVDLSVQQGAPQHCDQERRNNNELDSKGATLSSMNVSKSSSSSSSSLSSCSISLPPKSFIKQDVVSGVIRHTDETHQHLLTLLNPCSTVMDENIGCALWYAAQGVGVWEKALWCRPKDFKNNSAEAHSSVETSSPTDGATSTTSLSSKYLRSVQREVGGTAATTTVPPPLSHHQQQVPSANCRREEEKNCPLSEQEVAAGLLLQQQQRLPSAAAAAAGVCLPSEAFEPLLNVLVREGGVLLPPRDTAEVVSNTSTDPLSIPTVSGAPAVVQRSSAYPRSNDCPMSDEHCALLLRPNPVLLSTLGKEYQGELTPHWTKLGYKRLGDYLNAAERQGCIKFIKPRQQLPTESASMAVKNRNDGGRAICLTEPQSLKRLYLHLIEQQANAERRLAHDVLYVCLSRVVLVGMGADETLGGYMRYRRAALRDPLTTSSSSSQLPTEDTKGTHLRLDPLEVELYRDFERLWLRNLGRDDRCISDSGREGRYPFLDEGVLETLQDLGEEYVQRPSPSSPLTAQCTPPSEGHLHSVESPTHSLKTCHQAQQELVDPRHNGHNKSPEEGREGHHVHECGVVFPYHHFLDPLLPAGLGDKKLLRTVARRILQLPLSSSNLQKRAIQFGSRIADPKVRGTECLPTPTANTKL